jgi:hypothetical protein
LGKAGVGGKTLRATLAITLASILALVAWVPMAGAEPLSMTFTEARANVGVQLSDAALFEAPDTAPLEAQLGPAGESITAGELDVPQFSTHITSPINADVTVDFDIGVITGSFIEGTGGLTLEGTAGGTLKATGKECTVSTIPAVLALSTTGNSGGTSPRAGAPFTHGLTGAGSIAGQWNSMHASPVDSGDTSFCEDVEDQIEGPGGIWLAQAGDIVAPSAPQLTSTDPASPGLSGTPRIRGTAEAGSTVRLYAGSSCTGTPVATGSAAELGSPGIRVDVPTGVTATFSATATDAAANTSACSALISYTHQHGDPPPSVRCVVPRLAGKKLARAKAALREAHCAVGVVTKPKARKGKRLGQLVVKSSTPSAGQILAAGGKVSLTLGPRPRKAHR